MAKASKNGTQWAQPMEERCLCPNSHQHKKLEFMLADMSFRSATVDAGSFAQSASSKNGDQV
jgi:hypothetical protein